MAPRGDPREPAEGRKEPKRGRWRRCGFRGGGDEEGNDHEDEEKEEEKDSDDDESDDVEQKAADAAGSRDKGGGSRDSSASGGVSNATMVPTQVTAKVALGEKNQWLRFCRCNFDDTTANRRK